MRGFGLVWYDHPALAQRIGCPLAPEAGLAGRVQRYEHGLMVWLDVAADYPGIDTSPWVVVLAGDSATRHRVPAGVDWDDETTEPAGAFAWVWENAFADRERLGAATSTVHDTDAAVQRFERGTMIWVRNPGDNQPMIYVVESDLLGTASGQYEAFPDRGFN